MQTNNLSFLFQINMHIFYQTYQINPPDAFLSRLICFYTPNALSPEWDICIVTQNNKNKSKICRKNRLYNLYEPINLILEGRASEIMNSYNTTLHTCHYTTYMPLLYIHATTLYTCHYYACMPLLCMHATTMHACHYYACMPLLCMHATTMHACHYSACMPLLCRCITSLQMYHQSTDVSPVYRCITSLQMYQ